MGYDRRRWWDRSHHRLCELKKEENVRDGASSMVGIYSKVAAGDGEIKKHLCDDGALMYNPMTRVVVAFTITIHDVLLLSIASAVV